MADQVNPSGGLAPGLSLPLLVASATKSAPETSRPAKSADTPAPRSGGLTASASVKTPEIAAELVNGHLQQAGSELKLQVDKATGRTVYRVINPGTGEVVLQVPSEEVLAMARNLRALGKQSGASGVLVDKEG